MNIVVSDINDKNPEFTNLPYEYFVREGINKTFVGQVTATDADEGMNANITYSLPADVPFAIDPVTGNITTKTALDYEKEKVSLVGRTMCNGICDHVFIKSELSMIGPLCRFEHFKRSYENVILTDRIQI